MARFDDLPNELLAEIIVHCDTESLAVFSCVSRQVYTLSISRLFSALENGTPDRLRLFTRSLVERPELQRYVRTIEMGMWDVRRRVILPANKVAEERRWLPGHPFDRNFPQEQNWLSKSRKAWLPLPAVPEFITNDLEILHKSATEIGFEPKWLTKLAENEPAIHLVLLLCLTPRLQNLNLGPISRNNGVSVVLKDYLSSLLRDDQLQSNDASAEMAPTAGFPTRLQELTTVFYMNADGASNVLLPGILCSLISLPSVRTITAVGPLNEGFKTARTSSSLQTLILRNTTIDGNGLWYLCKHSSPHIQNILMYFSPTNVTYISTFSVELEPLQDTLGTLELWACEVKVIVILVRSFHEFKHLKRLSIPFEWLCGKDPKTPERHLIEVLPPNLQELDLAVRGLWRLSSSACCEEVIQLVRQKETMFTNFISLSFMSMVVLNKAYTAGYEIIEAECKARDISCVQTINVGNRARKDSVWL